MAHQFLEDVDLADSKLIISSGEERRSYTIDKRAGSGKNAVTWKAFDQFGTAYAIKIVLKAGYKTHNIFAEVQRVRHLSANLFAQIITFGDPVVSDFISPELKTFIESSTYAIVVEWVEGETLKKYLTSSNVKVSVPEFLTVASKLCEALALLQRENLTHRDLHEENILVTKETIGPRLTEELKIRIIDSGSMMTLERHKELMSVWQEKRKTLIDSQSHETHIQDQIEDLTSWIGWFSRTDQEWVVYHLTNLANLVFKSYHELDNPQRKFCQALPEYLKKMVDPDASMRLDNPAEMYADLELLWKTCLTPSSSSLMTPFDYISAELIRNDIVLNNLFSDKCSWIQNCATTDPIYIYGPRGCGKSTILRKLSVSGILSGESASETFANIPYIGVYISCSSELRSRFWLFSDNHYEMIEADAILFFNMLLADALLESLELLRDGKVEAKINRSVGLTYETAKAIYHIICEHFDLRELSGKLQGVSWLMYAKQQLAIKRNEVWRRILEPGEPRTPDPSVIFSVCKDIEQVFPLLIEKHIAFLVDDYSNQRIPVRLQRSLNQSISFAKQGNPIFKVSSEYLGVDLDGIQEGREVVEINLGKEYVDLTERSRSVFLEDVLDIRFRRANVSIGIVEMLGKSNLSPGIPMARSIKEASDPEGKKFYYHGIDTIADICSGDLAMALDLVKQIYVRSKQPNLDALPVKPAIQHELIREYADREHMYLRYFAKHGKRISYIIDQLCYLAHEAAVKLVSKKDGKSEPMIKTHLDITQEAINNIPGDEKDVLFEMLRKGVLFSLDTSRSRIANHGTFRYQVRRILLARSISPLGRRDAIKIDGSQKLMYLLQNPDEFVQEEISQQGKLRF
jgi:serine/threonine protein kinase